MICFGTIAFCWIIYGSTASDLPFQLAWCCSTRTLCAAKVAEKLDFTAKISPPNFVFTSTLRLSGSSRTLLSQTTVFVAKLVLRFLPQMSQSSDPFSVRTCVNVMMQLFRRTDHRHYGNCKCHTLHKLRLPLRGVWWLPTTLHVTFTCKESSYSRRWRTSSSRYCMVQQQRQYQSSKPTKKTLKRVLGSRQRGAMATLAVGRLLQETLDTSWGRIETVLCSTPTTCLTHQLRQWCCIVKITSSVPMVWKGE